MAQSKYIRFDWAMKRLLRNKVNFGVLEGLLTTLLGERITIQKLMENSIEDSQDKFSFANMIVTNEKQETFWIEIQNHNEYAYFERTIFDISQCLYNYILSLIHI